MVVNIGLLNSRCMPHINSLRICTHSLQPTILQALSQLLLGYVQIVHVGGVVLAVMQLHDVA